MVLCFQFPFFCQGVLLYALSSISWILHHNHPFLSPILTLHYHFLIPLVIVILVDMLVMLGPLVGMVFYTRLEILNTIPQLILMGFVVLNGWYPTMVYP